MIIKTPKGDPFNVSGLIINVVSVVSLIITSVEVIYGKLSHVSLQVKIGVSVVVILIALYALISVLVQNEKP
jgi:hypothetical protein